MAYDASASAVRILSKDGVWTGCGFVIEGRKIMTCAHVVTTITDGDQEKYDADVPMDEHRIYVHFVAEAQGQDPIAPVVALDRCLNEYGQWAYPARVTRAALVDDVSETHGHGWVPLTSQSTKNDMAVLELVYDDHWPDRAKPAPIALKVPSQGSKFFAFSMPEAPVSLYWSDQSYQGTTATGVFGISAGNGLLDVQKDEHGGRDFVLSGTSGSAAWSRDLEAVVGMVTRSNPSDNRAAIRPVSHLIGCWPPLGGDSSSLGPDNSNLVPLTLYNRGRHANNFKTKIEAHFGKTPVGSGVAYNKPFVTLTSGGTRDGHEYFRARVRLDVISRRYAGNDINHVGLSWPEGLDPASALAEMEDLLCQQIQLSSGQSVDKIAAKLNDIDQPVLMSLQVVHRKYYDEDAQIITDLIDYLDQIWSSGLAVEFYLFVDCIYCDQTEADGDLAKALTDTFVPHIKGRGVMLRRYQTVYRDEREDWFNLLLKFFTDPEERRDLNQRSVQIKLDVARRFVVDSQPLADLVESKPDFKLFPESAGES